MALSSVPHFSSHYITFSLWKYVWHFLRPNFKYITCLFNMYDLAKWKIEFELFSFIPDRFKVHANKSKNNYPSILMFIRNGKTEEKDWLRSSFKPLFTAHRFPEDQFTSCPSSKGHSHLRSTLRNPKCLRKQTRLYLLSAYLTSSLLHCNALELLWKLQVY